jgi:hypothetical protein
MRDTIPLLPAYVFMACCLINKRAPKYDRCWPGSDDRVMSDIAALLASCWLSELHFYPEDGGSTSLQMRETRLEVYIVIWVMILYKPVGDHRLFGMFCCLLQGALRGLFRNVGDHLADHSIITQITGT